MCGIFVCRPAIKSWLKNSIVEHRERGPDQNAEYIFGDIGLSVNRLAITGNLAEGAQPVSSRSNKTICVFNGAIYNSEYLIKKFSLNPISMNDGAAALELYELIGVEFVNYLQGMFSLIIIDKEKTSLLVTRDMLGIKPLYWVKHEGNIVFSSSLTAIPSKLQIFAEPFPPGLVWVDNDFKQSIKPEISPNENIEEVLLKSVLSHIPKEVSWGVGLSGGVDSALLSAMAKSEGYNFNCYVLKASHGEDPQAAQLVADHLRLPLKIVTVSIEDIQTALPIVVKALATYRSEIIFGGLLTYFISKAAASDGLKVLLFGEGADEVFGGYNKYKEKYFASKSLEHVNRMMIEDQNNLCLSHNWRVDHASMAMSIEARVPFQDMNVVVNARNIPMKDKVNPEHKLQDKILLREIASKYLPESLARRKKASITQGTGINHFGDAVGRELAKVYGLKQSDPIVKVFEIRSYFEFVSFYFWKKFYPKMAESSNDLLVRGLFPKGVI